VDVNQKNKEGYTGLMLALKGKSVLTPDVVDLLLKRGINVNSKHPDGRTAIVLAIMAGQPEIVKSLINRKAKYDLMYKGLTTLMLASMTGNIETVKTLVNRGLNVDAKNIKGHTAENIARAKRFMDIVGYLHERSRNKAS